MFSLYLWVCEPEVTLEDVVPLAYNAFCFLGPLFEGKLSRPELMSPSMIIAIRASSSSSYGVAAAI
jgi:hypothetical protein